MGSVRVPYSDVIVNLSVSNGRTKTEDCTAFSLPNIDNNIATTIKIKSMIPATGKREIPEEVQDHTYISY